MSPAAATKEGRLPHLTLGPARMPLAQLQGFSCGTERHSFRGSGEQFSSVLPASTVQPQCMSPDKLNIQSADRLGPHDLRLEGEFSSSVLWMSVTWGTPCPMLCLMSYTGPKPGGPLGDRGGKHGEWVLPGGSRFPGKTTGLTHQCPLSSQDPFQSFNEGHPGCPAS